MIDGTKDINDLKTNDWRRLTGVENPNNFPIYFTTLKVFRGCARPSVRPFVGPLRLFKNSFWAHLMASIGSYFTIITLSSSNTIQQVL